MSAGRFVVAVDLGTSWTRAVTAARTAAGVAVGGDVVAEPTVATLGDDGTPLVGSAALVTRAGRRAGPVRGLRRRLGDPAPLIEGHSGITPDDALRRLVASVARAAAAQQHGVPTSLVFTHPASWGPFRLESLARLAPADSSARTLLMAEPAAAALGYDATVPLPDGTALAVLDLGGGSLDATIVRKESGIWTPAGESHSEPLAGGEALDDLVAAALHEDLATLAPEELRHRSSSARESLSRHDAVTVTLRRNPVELRLTRDRLEELVRPALVQGIEALHRALASTPAAPHGVLLVGGLAATPLAARMVREAVNLTVIVRDRPDVAVVTGAAVLAARSLPASSPVPLTGVPGRSTPAPARAASGVASPGLASPGLASAAALSSASTSAVSTPVISPAPVAAKAASADDTTVKPRGAGLPLPTVQRFARAVLLTVVVLGLSALAGTWWGQGGTEQPVRPAPAPSTSHR